MPKTCCKHKGCKLEACYNFAHVVGREYCRAHMLPGMIDKISRRCQHEGCNTIAHFGFPGTRRSHCSQHKLEGMIGSRLIGKANFRRGCEDKTTLKRAPKTKPRSRSSSPSSCSSGSSVNSSRSMASRATKIGKVWQTTTGAFFVPSLPRPFCLS